MPRQRLTTERVLAEFERVIQSNRHFHLNDSVDVNVVHVEMPRGGTDHQNALIYIGPDQEKRIYLYLHDNHYDIITKMPGFFARKKYCHTCKKAYDHREDHLCPNACPCCRFPDCPVESGFAAMTVTECSKVKHVLIDINSQVKNRSVRRWLSARSVIELSSAIKEIRIIAV
ncbi:Hypothetical predicted protein [Paramuricea clavata]|uniref:Uncharacterized protein n=1 Tax=Paramuricea clavata TaxID=317549 RepID=A0A6S7JXM8_PARCT|nr:Hypothetical predicted protein [Paramuricea clavata]